MVFLNILHRKSIARDGCLDSAFGVQCGHHRLLFYFLIPRQSLLYLYKHIRFDPAAAPFLLQQLCELHLGGPRVGGRVSLRRWAELWEEDGSAGNLER
jgi:hypothetical protein